MRAICMARLKDFAEEFGVGFYGGKSSVIKDAYGFAHRLRDTFAVALLLKGVPLQTVSILLGHTSSRTTEKHYSPWVQSRQIALEEAVKKTWA
jgi:integrase